MNEFKVVTIGEVNVDEEGMRIQLESDYLDGLKGLEGFQYLTIVWWFHKLDTPQYRSVHEMPQPYKGAPKVMGVFATRSPIRPNPLAITTVEVLHIDYETGTIVIPYIDADDGSPVLDIKPYTPSIDRVEEPGVPAWCENWPTSYEVSGDFAWKDVFNF